MIEQTVLVGKIWQVGKVEVQLIAPKIFKLTMNTWWFNHTGIHYEKALIEISKKYKIVCVTDMRADTNYKLVFVE